MAKLPWHNPESWIAALAGAVMFPVVLLLGTHITTTALLVAAASIPVGAWMGYASWAFWEKLSPSHEKD